jgi:HEXXH motif-containing protein
MAHGEEVAASSNGLTEYVLDFTTGTSTLDTVWHPAFGRTQSLLKGTALQPSEVAARLGLRLAEAGHQGAWTASMPAETLVLGSLLLRSVVNLDVEINCAVRRITVTTSDGSELHIHYEPRMACWRGATQELRSVALDRPILLLPECALPATGRSAQRFLGPGTTPVSDISDAMLEDFAAGLLCVHQYAPGFVPWIERVLRGVVVCDVEVGFRVVSGSGEDAPGIIHASYPVSPMDIAEMLVHECTHQYFYMVQRVGPVDDGTDEELYWSPPIRMNRPLSRILMAYHALGNIRLFYDRVRASGGHAELEYVEANYAAITGAIADLDVPLRGNPALTDIGRGLYEPLADRLLTSV